MNFATLFSLDYTGVFEAIGPRSYPLNRDPKLVVMSAPKWTYAGPTNVQFVPQAGILARLADGLTFEFEFLACHILPPIRA